MLCLFFKIQVHEEFDFDSIRMYVERKSSFRVTYFSRSSYSSHRWSKTFRSLGCTTKRMYALFILKIKSEEHMVRYRSESESQQ